MNILAITGSLRQKSTNKGLLRYVQSQAPSGVTITIADLSDVPFYNADITQKPAAVETLLQQIGAADAFIFGCNEYNYSIAPALKNALDWASREPNNALLEGKPVALMGAAGGMGSSRSQYHLRQVCVFLNLHVLNKPEVFANAFTNFDVDGNLTDEKIKTNIQAQLAAFVKFAQQFKK